MCEIADLFPWRGDRERADGDIQPALGKAEKRATKVRLAKFIFETELFCDLAPQFDADTGPRSIGFSDIERWAFRESDDKLLLGNRRVWYRRREIFRRRPCPAHG